MTQVHGIQRPSGLDSGLSSSNSSVIYARAAVQAALIVALQGGLFVFEPLPPKSILILAVYNSTLFHAPEASRRIQSLASLSRGCLRPQCNLLFGPDKRNHGALRLGFQLYSEGLSVGRHCHVIHPHNFPVEFVGLVNPDIVHLG